MHVCRICMQFAAVVSVSSELERQERLRPSGSASAGGKEACTSRLHSIIVSIIPPRLYTFLTAFGLHTSNVWLSSYLSIIFSHTQGTALPFRRCLGWWQCAGFRPLCMVPSLRYLDFRKFSVIGDQHHDDDWSEWIFVHRVCATSMSMLETKEAIDRLRHCAKSSS
jgi:predicted small integral membrane protein